MEWLVESILVGGVRARALYNMVNFYALGRIHEQSRTDRDNYIIMSILIQKTYNQVGNYYYSIKHHDLAKHIPPVMIKIN